MTASTDGLSKEERQAVRDRARELKAQKTKEDGLKAVLDAIGQLEGTDRRIAETFHEIVTEVAPDLAPRTYYGMPAYARNGKVLCFFQPASKFRVRYATIGFETTANLDEGSMWPVGFAILDIGPDEEARIRSLVRLAAG